MKPKLTIGKSMNYLVLFAFSIACILPLFIVLSASFSSSAALNEHGFSVFPRGFTTEAYDYIIGQPKVLLRAYGVTIFITFIGTVLSVFMNALLAYPLSRKDFMFRNPLTFYIFFTMLFNGGLVPSYILISRYLHLKDTIWVLIVPLLVNAWYVIIMRTFFKDLPDELVEAAKMEGASEIGIFLRIILPLSTPVLGTIGLFCTLSFWNDWFMALLYIESEHLKPLQLLLYNIQSAISALQFKPLNVEVSPPAMTIRMATVVVTTGPLVFCYLFFQKYFVRGLTFGAVKG
ncbi:carbohydrate ABC transporter permease [Paenibacillus gansuensis]|uniref:Carbohydrate ABC transporter permease n=1 Tax=Paenibacillus gansuensis TaxID=306542 RepID=A0ABW5P8M6_9BACL